MVSVGVRATSSEREKSDGERPPHPYQLVGRAVLSSQRYPVAMVT